MFPYPPPLQLTEGEVFNYNDQSFTVVTELPQGVDLSPLNGQVANGQTAELTNAAGYSGEVQVAAGDPTVPDLLPALSTSRNLRQERLLEFEGNYYQALSDMPKGWIYPHLQQMQGSTMLLTLWSIKKMISSCTKDKPSSVMQLYILNLGKGKKP